MIGRRRGAGEAGFTLVELAVVIMIVGLLFAGILGPLTTQLEARARSETRRSLDAALEALYGFAVLNRRLPCADADGDGLEEPAPCAAGDEEGPLPWRTLGLAPGDAWGNHFTYRVDPAFSVPKVPGEPCLDDEIPPDTNDFDLCELGNLTVLTRGDNPATSPAVEGKFPKTVLDIAAAVIVSHGANGYGATRVSDNAVVGGMPAANADEQENANGDAVFLDRIYSRGAGGCTDDANEATGLCEFDDIVRWVSPTILLNRMVQAGRLP